MIRDILEEHVTEVVDLSDRWVRTHQSLEGTLSDLRAREQRLGLHLVGLAQGAGSSWELTRELLEAGGIGEGFAATFCAFEVAGQDAAIDEWTERLNGASSTTLTGAQAAVSWSRRSPIEPRFQRLMNDTESTVAQRAVALGGLGRSDVRPSDAALDHALRSDFPPLVATALDAVAAFRVDRQRTAVLALVESDVPEIVTPALQALCLLSAAQGEEKCREVLKRAAEAPPAQSVFATACRFLALRGAPHDLAVFRSFAEHPDPLRAREALLALGASGHLDAIPTLIQATGFESRGGVAAAALTRMLGDQVPLVPRPVSGAPSDDDLEAVWCPDSELPPVEPEPIRDWWSSQSGRFDRACRYCGGKPLGIGDHEPDPRLWYWHLDRVGLAVAGSLAAAKVVFPQVERC